MGKSSTQKTDSSVKPLKMARPYLKEAAANTKDIYNANSDRLAGLSDEIYGYMPQLADRAFGDNPMYDAATGYATDVLGGKYLSGNPYLEGIIDSTGESITNRVNGVFSSAGRTGSGGHTGTLTKELAEAENSLRYGDYNTQMTRMDQTLGQVPALMSANNPNIAAYLSASELAANLPYTGAQNAAQIYSGLFSPYSKGQQTTTQSGGGVLGGIGGLLGAGLSGWASGGFA